jgi:hypothetical protein
LLALEGVVLWDLGPVKMVTMAFNPKFTIANVINGALTRIERARRFREKERRLGDWTGRTRARAGQSLRG